VTGPKVVVPIPASGQLRIAIRVAAMAAALAICVTFYLLWTLAPARNPWPRIFLGWIGRISGLRLRIAGRPGVGRLLILANHISWLDIPALTAATGTSFVAQDGLAAVPLLKWLCEMHHTVFVARHDRTGVAQQVAALRQALAATGTITIFPETTTSDGHTLLPFKSSLLAALDPLPPGITVQPVWLDYGKQSASIAWVGVEAGLDNFKSVAARAQPIELTVHFLEPLIGEALTNRKTMTTAAREAIEQAMMERKAQDAGAGGPHAPGIVG
jgi:1-acyl-sn-glycerol-3-phosphate acyltransferase